MLNGKLIGIVAFAVISISVMIGEAALMMDKVKKTHWGIVR